MKKKFLVTCGIFTIGATLFSNSIFAATGTITASAVRIRKEASTSSEVISLATEGEKVNVIGKEDDWYKVEFEDVTGYISSSYVDTDYESSSLNASNSNNNSNSENNDNNNNSNNNTENNNNGNNSDNNTQTPEENNSNNTQTPEENNSNNTQTPEENNPNNSETSNDGNTNSTESTTPQEGQGENVIIGTKVTLSKEISIRTLPNFSSRVTTNIANNTELTILDDLNNWVKVTDGSVTGWGTKSDIGIVTTSQNQGGQTSNSSTPEENPTTPEVNEPENNSSSTEQNIPSEQTPETNNTQKTGKVNVDRAVIRKTPDGDSIDVLLLNTKVDIIGEDGDWYKINCEDYDGVYIAKRIVDVD